MVGVLQAFLRSGRPRFVAIPTGVFSLRPLHEVNHLPGLVLNPTVGEHGYITPLPARAPRKKTPQANSGGLFAPDVFRG
jgi:hypothetical protein